MPLPRRHKPKKLLYVTDDPFKRKAGEHNYMKKIAQAQADGRLEKIGVFQTHVYHDDNCRIYDGMTCNCNCDVVIEKEDGTKITL